MNGKIFAVAVATLTAMFMLSPVSAQVLDDDFQVDAGAWTGWTRTDLGGGDWVYKDASGAGASAWNCTQLPLVYQLDFDFQRVNEPATAIEWRFGFHLGRCSGVRVDQAEGYHVVYEDDWGTDNDGLQLWRRDELWGEVVQLDHANIPVDLLEHHIRVITDGTGIIRVYFDNMDTPVFNYDDSANFVGAADQYMGFYDSSNIDGWVDNVVVSGDDPPAAVDSSWT